MNTNTLEYATWMAEVWKKNAERNVTYMLLPDGKTSYQEYCNQILKMRRTPLPYDALFEESE